MPDWWKEFCPKEECFGDIQVKGMAHWQASAFRMPAASWKRTAVGLLCSALPGCVGVKGLSPLEGLPRSLGLARGATWRNGGVGHGPSEVHHQIWNATRAALQSSTRGQQMPALLLERGDLLDLKMLDMAGKHPVTPAPAERALSLRPRVEEPISVPTPNEPPTSEPKEAA